MALEAAFQYSSLQGNTISPSSEYRLREVTVSRSMVLEEDIPTEVTLVMRPQREGTHSISKTWNHFLVCSWTQKGGWIEHCQGLISVKVDSAPRTGYDGATEELEKTLDPVDIHARFSKGGLEFGPAFRNITSVHASLGHSVGTVTIPDTARMMPFGFENIHIIHPGTFDACFQLVDAAASGGDLTRVDLHVPTFVKSISVRHGLPKAPGDALTVCARAGQAFSSFDPNIRGSFAVFDSETTRLIEVNGLVASKLPSTDIEIGQSTDRSLCYKMVWEPCVDLIKFEQFTNVFCRSLTISGSTTQAERLDKAAFWYIQSAVGCISAEDLDRLPSHLQKYYEALGTWLEQGKQASLPLPRRDWLDVSNSEKQQLIDDLEALDGSGRLVCRIGQALPSILKGEVEPLSIMLKDDLLGAYYKSFGLMNRGIEIAASIIASLGHQTPHMKILEVGAGTGSSTIPMLRALGQRFARYDFTDISTGFFEAARREQTQWADRISYQRFDIEQDPVTQGFELESYDLIIACNVLHATANITRTMRNVRSLLRPEGKVLIGEITSQLLSNAIIFGTLPGWWLGEEPERYDKPFLNESEWGVVLRQTGFSGLDSQIQTNPEGPSLGSFMLATAHLEQEATTPEFSLVLPNRKVETNLMQSLSALISDRFHQKPRVEHIADVDLEDRYAIVVALEDTTWLDMTAEGLEKMQSIFRSARGILWVVRGASSQNPVANMVFGFARSMRPENAGLRFSTLDIDAASPLPDDKVAETIIQVAEMVFDTAQERFAADVEFAEINGILHIPRVVGEKAMDNYIVHETDPPVSELQPFKQEGRPLKMKLGQIGLLDTIHFADNKSLQLPLADNDVEISIQAAGLNFKDVMMSLGQIPFYHDLGLECSGVVSAIGSNVSDIKVGDRVCGMVQGAYATSVRVNNAVVARIPPDIGFAEAASIPVVFCTARYALSDMGRLSKGDSVLIHAASGGVGQAAIMLAQHAEADIYVTVSSLAKRKLLTEIYGIAEDHIFSSRDTSFAKELLSMTGGRGVDVVLNSTAGEILHQSWHCLAPLGRFVEIGKRDITLNANLEMEKFAESVSFISVDLGVLLDAKPQLLKRLLTDVLQLHEQKVIHPVTPITTLPMSAISQAMRMMQGGKHIGKVVIETKDDDIVQASPAPSPKVISNPDSSYLISGGTGGLGRSITRWLSREGAKNIILVSRSGLNQKNVPELVEELRAMDVNVVVEICDISDRAQVQHTIEKCSQSMPPIRGVIHGAMALRDCLFDKMSFEDWTMNLAPRVHGAWNLHHCLSSAPLDFFVILASGSGIAGNPGQTAYAASNTFLDSFAAYRQSLGLPASAIDIGIVEGVGYVAENIELRNEIQGAAHDRLSEQELLVAVKAAIINPDSTEYMQTMMGCKLVPDKPLTFWATDPKFAHVLHAVQMQAPSSSDSSFGRGVVSVRHLLKGVSSIEDATGIITAALNRKLSSLLAVPVEEIDTKKPIVAYGLNSLVAVEFRNWITVDLEANVPLMELMNSASIEALAGKLAAKSKLVEKLKIDRVEEEAVAEEEGDNIEVTKIVV